jgi:hypothetical protein
VDNRWHIQLEEVSGELILPLPQDLLRTMGWCEGTRLRWVDNRDGSFQLEICDAEDVG